MNPDKVHILGFDYDVVYESSDLSNSCIGYISYRKHKITVDSSVSPAKQRETLLHEIIHGIDDAIGAGDRVTEEEHRARVRVMYAWLSDPRNRAALDWISGTGGETCQDNPTPAMKTSP